MADHRYLPLNLQRAAECELFVLPGAGSSLDAFWIGGIYVTRLPIADWLLIEKGRFIDDLIGTMIRRSPLFCTFLSYDWDVPDAVAQHRSSERLDLVRRLVRSLRLWKEGIIYDPRHFVTYARRGSINVREPGLYGRAGYELPESYTIDVSELDQVERIFHALWLFDKTHQANTIAAADILFNESYERSLAENRDRFLILLGALEALLEEPPDVLARMEWAPEIEAFVSQYRQERNRIAHGEIGMSDDGVLCLRHIVRVLLHDAIATVLDSQGSIDVEGIAERRRRTLLGTQLSNLQTVSATYGSMLEPTSDAE